MKKPRPRFHGRGFCCQKASDALDRQRDALAAAGAEVDDGLLDVVIVHDIPIPTFPLKGKE